MKWFLICSLPVFFAFFCMLVLARAAALADREADKLGLGPEEK